MTTEPRDEQHLVHESTRALLRCTTPEQIAAIARQLVVDLGGDVADPLEAGAAGIPVDVSFGVGEARVPVAPMASVARLLLERHVPPFVEDCHRVRGLLGDLRAPAPNETADSFVAVSDISVDASGADELAAAFGTRMGAVDAHAGFQRLEVWADERDPTHFAMVSWWATHDDFLRYMRSDDHRCSHARVPTAGTPRPQRFTRYKRIAT